MYYLSGGNPRLAQIFGRLYHDLYNNYKVPLSWREYNELFSSERFLIQQVVQLGQNYKYVSQLINKNDPSTEEIKDEIFSNLCSFERYKENVLNSLLIIISMIKCTGCQLRKLGQTKQGVQSNISCLFLSTLHFSQ